MNISILAMVSLTGFLALSLYAAAHDFRKLSIPNAVILTLLGGYLLLAAGSGWSQEEITSAMLAASIVLFAGFLVYSLGWSGAGDGKFAAVCTLWIGAAHTLDFLFLTTLIGAGLAVTIVVVKRLRRSKHATTGPAATPSRIAVPYGLAISLAAFCMLPQSPWLSAVPA